MIWEGTRRPEEAWRLVKHMTGPEATAKMAKQYPETIVGVKSAHYEGPEWIPVDRAVQAGKAAGILVERDNVERYRDRGVGFLYAHANAFLSHGAHDFADLLAKR